MSNNPFMDQVRKTVEERKKARRKAFKKLYSLPSNGHSKFASQEPVLLYKHEHWKKVHTKKIGRKPTKGEDKRDLTMVHDKHGLKVRERKTGG
jgi:hypothetical protein